MAENIPAIANMTKFSVGTEKPSNWNTWLEQAPTSAPNTSSGRKIPPGTPEPKLTME